jgi:endonuclease YncB( thermonuclease family)
MKIKFSRRFTDYRAAATWLDLHNYSESVVEIANSDTVTVTLEGDHAKHAIEAATRAKVVQEVRT